MQQHDEESEQLGAELNRMLRALPREHEPDPELEENIAQQLRSRQLLAAGHRSVQPRRTGVAITWPAAAAAAAVLFVSGVVVGAASGRSTAPLNAGVAVSNSSVVTATPHSAADLLLSSGNRGSVTRAIKF